MGRYTAERNAGALSDEGPRRIRPLVRTLIAMGMHMSELLDRVVTETRKMKQINLHHPVSISSQSEEHQNRFSETREQAEVYRWILDLILRVTRCDCVVLTTIEGEYPDCSLLGGLSDLSDSAKNRLAEKTLIAAPSRFDSPVDDPVNFLGHVFFENGLNSRETPFERSARDKGFFSLYVPDFETVTNVVCCAVTFDGAECPADYPGFPDMIALGRLQTARFLSQMELCSGASEPLAGAFRAAASEYVSAYQKIQNCIRSECTERNLQEFYDHLQKAILLLGFDRLKLSKTDLLSGDAATWSQKTVQFGPIQILSSGGDDIAELWLSAVGSSYKCNFYLSQDSNLDSSNIVFRRLATTLLEKIVLDLAVVALEQGFEKVFCR